MTADKCCCAPSSNEEPKPSQRPVFQLLLLTGGHAKHSNAHQHKSSSIDNSFFGGGICPISGPKGHVSDRAAEPLLHRWVSAPYRG